MQSNTTLMTKNNNRLALIAVALTVILILGVAGAFWYTWKTDPKVVIADRKSSPETIHIGDVIGLEVVLELPWYRRVTGPLAFEPPDGLQVLTSMKPRFSRLRFGKWRWVSVLELQAYDLGPFKDLTATIELTPDRNNENGTLTVELPDISPTSQLDDSESSLAMASELTEDFLNRSRPMPRWWLIAGILAAIVAFTLWMMRRRQTVREPEAPKPWVVAEKELFELQEKLPLPAATVFVHLTDIVRQYIEAVYDLPATETTTQEFLLQIKRDHHSALTASHGLLLTDFLTAADMVKFARLDASHGQIEDALNKAKRFVIETSDEIIKSNATSPGQAESTALA